MSEIKRSPLCWPQHFRRTSHDDRRNGQFSKKSERGFGYQELTLKESLNRVMQSLWAFSSKSSFYRCMADEAIVSSNLEIMNKSGFPASNQKKPNDPGVAVYFELDGKPRCIPCDTYLRIEDNLAAVAATIDALRTMERHGSQMFEAAFSGFDALPSPAQATATSWRDVFECYTNDIRDVEKAYMRMRKKTHPDYGGSTEDFNKVQAAWKSATDELEAFK